MKKNKRHTKSKRIGLLLLLLGIFGSITAFYLGFRYVDHGLTENSLRKTITSIKDLTVELGTDASLQEIADILYANEFIQQKSWFLLQGKLYGYDKKLLPGTYSISNNMSDLEILDLLTLDNKQSEEVVKFTIPEGYTIIQIAARLEEAGIVTQEAFLNAVNDKQYDYSFLQYIPQDTKYRLEGYLFPDTYIVPKQVTAEQIVIMMLNRFQEVASQYTQYLQDSSYTLHDVLTIASIIEQEAKLDDERPRISGVIYNRLESDMKLQMCSTIQYILEKRKANLSYDDLKVESPYNTYEYSGLPVGPICAPGQAAIQAAFMPEIHDYYYFVLKNAETGEHVFSRTGDEHEENQRKYQQSIDKNFYE